MLYCGLRPSVEFGETVAPIHVRSARADSRRTLDYSSLELIEEPGTSEPCSQSFRMHGPLFRAASSHCPDFHHRLIVSLRHVPEIDQ